ncbi:RrF2 family transcriptional regulator [Maribacter aurantiacus]|uniref:Rrf2 family transcriptional regulator n=1 Tax=Maribacter aurantiacus TaxID=1882343 RepID=A0A5R8M9Q7_9FLAO|nr:Rrf2 family transcriptional regulator [Maribacter aurantiacus]TLF46257.1 Rrf2 family transcriptional regulator [Maribacter aurantiacus]
MFSKACEYGIRAATYIAMQSIDGRRVSLNEISGEIGSPTAFTAKILQQLSRNGIIDATKGANGGYGMSSTDIKKTTLSQIVFAIDGDNIYAGCGLGLKECNAEEPCPVHDKFVFIRDNLRQMLESTSLYEMTLGLATGLTYLKR